MLEKLWNGTGTKRISISFLLHDGRSMIQLRNGNGIPSMEIDRVNASTLYTGVELGVRLLNHYILSSVVWGIWVCGLLENFILY